MVGSHDPKQHAKKKKPSAKHIPGDLPSIRGVSPPHLGRGERAYTVGGGPPEGGAPSKKGTFEGTSENRSVLLIKRDKGGGRYYGEKPWKKGGGVFAERESTAQKKKKYSSVRLQTAWLDFPFTCWRKGGVPMNFLLKRSRGKKVVGREAKEKLPCFF